MTSTIPNPTAAGQSAGPHSTGSQLSPAQAKEQARERADSPRGTTAERVLLISVLSTLVAVLVAVVGFVATQAQAAGMDRAASGADRVLTVMALRDAVLTADGAATNAFLVGGLEPQDRRAVYDEAIAEASTLLTELADGADSDAGLIAELNGDLTTYTSLVEAARVNNRQGFPVGAAYLDQASTLVREQMLVDLDTVLRQAADDAAGSFGVGALAYLALAVVIGAVVVLLVSQTRLARLSRRRLNVGLALTTVLLLIAVFAGAMTSVRAATTASETRTESYRPTLAVAQAGVLAAEARSLESFTLIKRGSGQAYEDTFVERTDEARDRLADEPELAELLQTWLDRHATIREFDDAGDWDGAVELAVSDDADGPSAAYTAFTDAVQAEVESGSSEVTSSLREAADGARLASWVLLVAGLLGAVAAWRGTAARREEYR